MVFRKSVLNGYNFAFKSPRLLNSVHQACFACRGKNRGRSGTCLIFNIYIHLKDIRRRTLKSSEIGLNFAWFWPLFFFFWGGEGPPKFCLVQTTVQNFQPIGQRSSEISWRKKIKTSALKHKPAPQAIASGRTIYC